MHNASPLRVQHHLSQILPLSQPAMLRECTRTANGSRKHSPGVPNRRTREAKITGLPRDPTDPRQRGTKGGPGKNERGRGERTEPAQGKDGREWDKRGGSRVTQCHASCRASCMSHHQPAIRPSINLHRAPCTAQEHKRVGGETWPNARHPHNRPWQRTTHHRDTTPSPGPTPRTGSGRAAAPRRGG